MTIYFPVTLRRRLDSVGRLAAAMFASAGLLVANPAFAQVQPFTSGSDGSFGAINVTADTTLQVPENGVINATTVNIDSSRTLTFTPNSRNTPILLLATGAVTLNGRIDIDGEAGTADAGGRGGPGGFDGGHPSSPAGAASAGHGPGRGLPGTNAQGTDPASVGGGNYGGYSGTGLSANDGATYGNALIIPLVGGSGGGGTSNGRGSGGGGGAIVVASDVSITMTISGGVLARGGSGNGAANAGSGGAIRLVAPTVSRAAFLDVSGPGPGTDNLSGHGRVRIDTLDPSAASGIVHTPNVSAVFSIGSFMLVEPNPLPSLDIIAAAGTLIPEDNGPVSVVLPNGAPSSQTVTVQARDFVGIVPIEVVVTPLNGASTTVMSQIDMAGGNPSTVDVGVQIPANTTAIIHVWRR